MGRTRLTGSQDLEETKDDDNNDDDGVHQKAGSVERYY
jgi:hypothetical protein